jgi:hypothetical protein
MRRVRARLDAPVDAEHSPIGVHKRQRIELKRGRARERGQHAKHPSGLIRGRRRHAKHAEPAGRREQPIALLQRIPADGVEDDLDPASACDLLRARFKVLGPEVELVYQITLGPAPPLVAALAQLTPVRFHLGQPVLHVGEEIATPRCVSVERCSGPVTPSPPGSLLQIRKQTLGPPSPFVAIPAQFVLIHL